MGIHPGPLATSPNQTTLPSEVIRVLGKLALESATAYVHIRSGIDSLLGDTHLVVIGGKLHVVARKSSLDPLEDVQLVALPEIDEEGYRSVLQLRTVAGDKRVEIGATEENAVHALVAGLSAGELDAPVVAPAVAEPVVAPAVAEPAAVAPPLAVAAVPEPAVDDVDAARAAFIGLLATRRAQRKAKLRADRVAHERAERRAPKTTARVAKPVTLRAEIGTATTDEDGDGIPDPPGERIVPAKRPDPPAGNSVLALVVLGLLLFVGFVAVVSRLLAEAR